MSGTPESDPASPADDLPPTARFAAELQLLRHRSGGLSIREVAGLMRRLGKPFPRSTVDDKLRGVSQPSWEFVEAFVSACAIASGAPPDLAGWRERHRRLRTELATTRPARAPRRAAASAPDPRGPAAAAGSGPVPRQLPAAVGPFRGRTAELRCLDAVLGGSPAPPAVPIALLCGTAGVGKTELALQWAHRRAADFPDGQLYVDLRGHDLAPPAEPVQVLPRLLRALGDPEAAPPDVDEQAARYRSRLAGRRVLIVLDNARDADQVRPLLPGLSGCPVLVTARDDLAGLVARHGARRIPVDPLPAADSLGLLEDLVGAAVRAEPGAAEQLVEQCARIPLALRVAAEVAAARPHETLRHLVRRLADEHRRLDVLASTDERGTVRTVLSWSYRSLPAEPARAFRLLAVHPGPDLDAHAVAALTGRPVPDAEALVDRLTRTHLLQRPRPGRLRQHDLLRAYARERLLAETPGDLPAARERLCAYYRGAAAAAMDLAFPAERRQRPEPADLSVTRPPLTDAGAARQWLDTEREALVGVVRQAAEDGRATDARALVDTVWRYLDTGALHAEAAEMYGSALAAARRGRDRAAEARVLQLQGILRWRQGRLEDAAALLRRSLLLHREIGDRLGEGGAHNALGLVLEEMGRTGAALAQLRAALAVAREAGERLGEASTLSNLGRLHERDGDHARALACQQRALEIFRAIGHRAGEGKILGHLGFLWCRSGDWARALDGLTEALQVCRECGDRLGEGWALTGLGWVHAEAGRDETALDRLRQALDVFEDVANPAGAGHTYCRLGDLHRRRGDMSAALDLHRRAYALGRQVDNPPLQAMALNSLAEDERQAGRTGLARARQLRALALARSAGDREQEERALAGLGADPG